jgi:hypothetical protein
LQFAGIGAHLVESVSVPPQIPHTSIPLLQVPGFVGTGVCVTNGASVAVTGGTPRKVGAAVEVEAGAGD